MSAEHTPEPWRTIIGRAVYSDTRNGLGNPIRVAAASGTSTDAAQANAARIVACVNALAGMDPAAVGEVVAALEDADNLLGSLACRGVVDMDDFRAQLTRCNDRARAALDALKGGGV